MFQSLFKNFFWVKMLISIISVDFSFALINSVSRAFNDCSLFIYIDLAYRLFIKKEDLPISLVTIASCSVHVIKFFCDKMSSLPKSPKKTAATLFAKCVMARSFDDFVNIFSILYALLKCQNIRTSIVSEAMQMTRMSLDIDAIIEESIETGSNSDIFTQLSKDLESESSLYIKSPFVRDLGQAIEDKISSSSGNLVSNNFFCDSAATYLLRRLGPFCALWSSFCHKRTTNTIVESHHKVVKNDLLKTPNIKPGTAIQELRVSVLAQLKLERNNERYRTIRPSLTNLDDPQETMSGA